MIQQISDKQIERAKAVLENHIVNPLTRAGALESGLFCIASQATPWEISSDFIYRLRQASHPHDPHAKFKYATPEVLTDKKRVNAAAHEAGWRFAYANRFDPFIDRFGSRQDEWWNIVKSADTEFRDTYVRNTKHLGCKTFSFWHLCLGGTNLIALDVWVMKGLKELGLEIPKDFIIPRAREDSSQKVRKTPSKAEYLRIEQQAKELFAQDERFQLENKKPDCALIDAVLWWGGANRGEPAQQYLFASDRSELILPYAQSEEHN